MIQLKFENLKEIHRFLYSSKPQKLKQKEINNPSQFIINEETKKYNKMPYNGGWGAQIMVDSQQNFKEAG